MKKLLLILSFMITAIGACAQNYGNSDNTITYGLAGGSNAAFLQLKSANREYVSTDAATPFSIGFNADFKFNDYFSVRPGIFYAGMGGTMNAVYVDDSENNVSVYDEYKLHYLQVNTDFIGHLPVGDGANIFLGAGPFYAYGLNGTNTQTLYTDNPIVYKMSFGKNGDFKSSDFGVSTVLGFQGAKGWSISANIDWGITDVMQNNTSGFDASQFKTITFYLSIGQSF
jgi:hypothetical protein